MIVLSDMIDVADLPGYLRFPTRRQAGSVAVAEEDSDSFEEHV